MRCSQCGRENDPGKRFCVQCGAPLPSGSGTDRSGEGMYAGFSEREKGSAGKDNFTSHVVKFLTDGLSRKKKALIILILILVLILAAILNVALAIEENDIPIRYWALNHEEVEYENGMSSETVESVSWK